MILNLSILDHPDKIINPLVKRELTEKIQEPGRDECSGKTYHHCLSFLISAKLLILP
jgi:hypothetical protein